MCQRISLQPGTIYNQAFLRYTILRYLEPSSTTQLLICKSMSSLMPRSTGALWSRTCFETCVNYLELRKPHVTLFARTDSIIVLHWLSQLLRTWTAFVASSVKFSKCPSTIKLAACFLNRKSSRFGSRSCSATQLLHSHLWLFRPTWLSTPTTESPDSCTSVDNLAKRSNAQL